MDFSKRKLDNGEIIEHFESKTIITDRKNSLDGRCLKCNSINTKPIKIFTKLLAKRKCLDCGTEFWSENINEIKENENILTEKNIELIN